MRITKRRLRRIIREEHADWGMGSHEDSRSRPGEEDYTGHAGDESKTHAGEDYEGGGDVEHKAMTAMAAIHDLASAAGVELDTSVAGPSDVGAEEEGGMMTMEYRRRRTRRLSERQLCRIIREEKRNIRRRLREDSIDDELESLRKNVNDDLDHIKDLKDDVKDDHDEELRAEKARKDETLRREIRKIVRETKRIRRRR